MGRPKVSERKAIKDRVLEHPGESLKVKDEKLWCDLCVRSLSSKKDTVKKHVQSDGHKSRKVSVAGTSKINEPKEDRYRSMAKAFAGAGVALYVFRDSQLRKFLRENLKGGHDLPSETTMRKKLVECAGDDLNLTRDLCKEKDVTVMIDESVDIKGRKVLNVLVGPLQTGSKLRLCVTKFLDQCDGKVMAHEVIETLNLLNIPLDNFVVLITDNVNYNLTAGKKLMVLCDRAMHTTCWCHIVNLLADEVRGEMGTADRFISEMKCAFTKCHERQRSYIEYLRNAGASSSNLPPTPVLTRWTTWLNAGSHHWSVITPTIGWIESSEDDSRVMKSLKAIVADEAQELAHQLERISKVYEGIAGTIRDLEREDIEASSVWPQLNLLRDYMVTLGLPPGKLNIYMEKKHPAVKFWNDVQCLDIRKCPTEFTEIPSSLLRFTKKEVPLSEITYFNFLRSQESVKSALVSKNKAIEFWSSHRTELPVFSELALKALCVLPSTSCVERSFSYLKKTLSPQRSSMTEENLGAHLRLVFNKDRENEDIAIEDEEFSDESESDSF